MILLKNEVKRFRKEKKLSQAELSEGICTQVTISKMENHGNIPTMRILMNICERLDIDIDQIIINDTDNNKYYNILKNVDELVTKMNHCEAYKYLTTNIPKEEAEELEANDKRKYCYYLGYLLTLVEKDYENANFYLGRANTILPGKEDMMEVLIKSAQGIMYAEQNDLIKAERYFELAVEGLNEIDKEKEWDKAVKIYFNAAKLYSDLKKYKMAIELSRAGLDILISKGSLYMYDLLNYELGYNIHYNGGDKKIVTQHFFISMAEATVNKNKELISKLKKNAKEFDLNFDFYNL